LHKRRLLTEPAREAEQSKKKKKKRKKKKVVGQPQSPGRALHFQLSKGRSLGEDTQLKPRPPCEKGEGGEKGKGY